jgi:hypothetical protein
MREQGDLKDYGKELGGTGGKKDTEVEFSEMVGKS